MNTLSSEDRQLLSELIEDWSYSTFYAGPGLNTADLKNGVLWLYELSRIKTPEVLIFDSPLACQFELQSLTKKGADMRRVETIVWPAVDFRMWSGLWWQVMGEFLKYRQCDALSAVEENLINFAMREAIEHYEYYVEFSEDNLLKRYRRAAYYDFLNRRSILIKFEMKQYIDFLKSGCFLSIFVHRHAVICRRPVSINYNLRGQFHNENGPAILWGNDEASYFLNGVKVNKDIVECPPDQMDTKMFLLERNLEVRREIVRRVGIDILLNRLGGKVIDRWQDYELVQLDVPDMRIKPTYLKMKNPSIGTFHVEGVPPNITSCQDALSWRVGGLKWDPEQLT